MGWKSDGSFQTESNNRYYFEQLKFTRDGNLQYRVVYFFREEGEEEKEERKKRRGRRKPRSMFGNFPRTFPQIGRGGGVYGMFGKKIRWRVSTKGERTEKERRNNIQRLRGTRKGRGREGSRNRCKIGRGPAHFRRFPRLFSVSVRFIEGMRRGEEIREIVYICQTRPSRKHFESFLMLEAS